MSPKTKTTADLLPIAVEDALQHVENGSTMLDAITKVASQLKLNSEQIKRACQLLNRANMNDTRLGADDLKSKLALVDVVDPQEVIRRCYGIQDSAAKTAAAPLAIATGLLKAASSSTTAVKHAAASPLRSPSAQPRATNKLAGLYHGLGATDVVKLEGELTRKMASADQAIKLAANGLKVAAKTANDILGRIHDSQKGELVDQARYYFEENAPDQLPTLFAVIDDVLADKPEIKLAIQPAVPDVWHKRMFGVGGFVPAIQQLDKLAGTFRSGLKTASQEWGEAKARLDHLRSIVVDGMAVNERLLIGKDTLSFDEDNIKQAASKLAYGMTSSFVGSMLGSSAGAPPAPRTVGPGVGPTDVDKFTLQIRQPQHEAALAAIRARANLQDLVNNDSVISGYDPNSVLAAFNDLSQYSPRATESNAVLRSALRQMLLNHASIFDLQQVRSTERGGMPVR